MHQLGRRERKKQEVSDRIREAAIGLFHEKGYEAATVEEIAERADVSKGTVFNYFPRKESLLALAAGDLIEKTKAVIGPPETWRGSVQDRIRRLFLGMVEVTGRHPDISRTLLLDCIKRPHVYAYEPSESDLPGSELQRMLRWVLREAQDAGEIRSDVDVEVAARLLESVLFNVLLFWLLREEPESELRRELTARLELVFHGLVPPADVVC